MFVNMQQFLEFGEEAAVEDQIREELGAVKAEVGLQECVRFRFVLV